jgi:alkylation response protein AidB-like acyl-CoA dehydrogenase
VLAAETLVGLSACRTVFSRAAALIDEHHALNATSIGTPDRLTSLFAETQTAKAFVGEAAVRIVGRALALSGGAGYVNGSPLARADTFLGQLAAGRTSTEAHRRAARNSGTMTKR